MSKKKLKGIAKGEYKGNDMAVIDGDARYPFQFGAAKAVQLLLVLATNGIAPVLNFLTEVAGDRLEKSDSNDKGLNPTQLAALQVEINKLEQASGAAKTASAPPATASRRRTGSKTGTGKDTKTTGQKAA